MKSYNPKCPKCIAKSVKVITQKNPYFHVIDPVIREPFFNCLPSEGHTFLFAMES